MKYLTATTLLVLSLGLAACAGSQGRADAGDTKSTTANGASYGDQGIYGYKSADGPYEGMDLHWNH